VEDVEISDANFGAGVNVEITMEGLAGVSVKGIGELRLFGATGTQAAIISNKKMTAANCTNPREFVFRESAPIRKRPDFFLGITPDYTIPL
jgi:hypothetical protein